MDTALTDQAETEESDTEEADTSEADTEEADTREHLFHESVVYKDCTRRKAAQRANAVMPKDVKKYAAVMAHMYRNSSKEKKEAMAELGMSFLDSKKSKLLLALSAMNVDKYSVIFWSIKKKTFPCLQHII